MSTPEGMTPAEEFQTIYSERETLENRVETAPELLVDLLQRGLEAADARLAELSRNPEVAEHFSRLSKTGEEILKASQELDDVELLLRAVGLDEEIDAKRQELEKMQAEFSAINDSPIMSAARYYMSLAEVQTVLVEDSASSEASGSEADKHLTLEEAAEELKLVVEDTTSKTAEMKESDKSKLLILVDPNNNISINGEAISLSRELKVAGKTGAEAAGRALRVDVLRYFNNFPNEERKARDIWEAIRPGQEFDRSMWNIYVKDFYRDEFNVNNKPVIEVDRVRPRLLHYRLGNFNLDIQDTDKAIEFEREGVYTFPSGKEVGGETGQLLHLLAKASENNPVTSISAPKLYKLMSRARIEAQKEGLTLVKVKVGVNPNTKRSYAGYYLAGLETEPAKNDDTSDDPEGSGPKVDRVGVDDLDAIGDEAEKRAHDYTDPSLADIEHRTPVDREAFKKLVEYYNLSSNQDRILLPDLMVNDLLDEGTIQILIKQAVDNGLPRMHQVRGRIISFHNGLSREHLEEELYLRGLTIQYGTLRKKAYHGKLGENLTNFRIYRVINRGNLTIDHFQPEEFDKGQVTWQITEDQKKLIEINAGHTINTEEIQHLAPEVGRIKAPEETAATDEAANEADGPSILNSRGRWGKELKSYTAQAIVNSSALGLLWGVKTASSEIKVKIKDLKVDANGRGRIKATDLLEELRDAGLTRGNIAKPLVKDIVLMQLLPYYGHLLQHEDVRVRNYALNIVDQAVAEYFRDIVSGGNQSGRSTNSRSGRHQSRRR
jgi:hypothetical protein